MDENLFGEYYEKLFAETQKSFEKIWKSVDVDGLLSVMDDFSNKLNALPDTTKYLDIWMDISKKLDAQFTLKMQEAMEKVLPCFDDYLKSIDLGSLRIPEIITTDWLWLSDTFGIAKEKEDKNYNYEELITDEICDEMSADVSTVLSNPQQAQEVSRSKYERWKKEHPFLAELFISILIPLLITLIGSFVGIKFGTTTRETNVYIEPNSDSAVIYNITGDNNVLIIDDVPYYYKVKVSGTENDAEIIGYAYKGNIIIDESGSLVVKNESTPDAIKPETIKIYNNN